MYLQPIKNDDPKLDFYTMYRRETTEYDTEHMQKHNDDLNTTLIFVRHHVLQPLRGIYTVFRPACSRRSAPHLLSASSQDSSQTLADDPKPISKPFSSASTRLFPRTKTLLLRPHGVALRQRSSLQRTFCMQAF